VWKNTTLNYIEKIFGQNTRDVGIFDRAFRVFNRTSKTEKEISVSYAHDLTGLSDHLYGLIGELETTIPLQKFSTPPSSVIHKKSSNKVFVVHGHNHPLKNELAHSLQNAGVDVTILHEQPNKGMTIIEKFAAHAQDAGYAVVLLTADDIGAAKPEGPLLRPMLKDRARQNVVFELGFFIGLLGRERVCALYEPGVEWPSDLNGIAYVEYDPTGRWINQIAKEINAAGIKLDFSKLP
jgi:predicted nucleotide-binding protein